MSISITAGWLVWLVSASDWAKLDRGHAFNLIEYIKIN